MTYAVAPTWPGHIIRRRYSGTRQKQPVFVRLSAQTINRSSQVRQRKTVELWDLAVRGQRILAISVIHWQGLC